MLNSKKEKMIAEVKPDGMIKLVSQDAREMSILQQFVKGMAVDSKDFMNCCRRKNCEFEIKLKE
jgi:hypothetical protein